MSAPEITTEERLQRIEQAAGEATAQAMVALLLAGEILPLVAAQHEDTEALLQHVQQSVRGRIEPFLGQAQTRGSAERALTLLGRVFDHAVRPFRRAN